MEQAPHIPFSVAWRKLVARPGMTRLLALIGLGTFGFGMADVLLEPYGGQALGFSVAQTTQLTALLAGGTLIGFGIASRVLTNGMCPVRLATFGAAVGVPGFLAIIFSSAVIGPSLFVAGTLATGVGAGLFSHGTLTQIIRGAPSEQIGLSLGAWGAVQATCAGIGVALAGIVRDTMVALPAFSGLRPETPYNVVFTVEVLFLGLAIVVAVPLVVRNVQTKALGSAPTPQANSLEAP
jgi:BCD family chlorophyll transporter-like MFS transporter